MSAEQKKICFNETQLINLYGLLFNVAYEDGELDKEELKKIFELVNFDGFSERGKKKVQVFLIEKPNINEILLAFKKDILELRYTGYLNSIEIAIANDDISEDQERLLKHIKAEFSISDDQDKKIREFAKKAKELAERGIDDQYAADALKSGIAGLGAVGVPVAAVYFSGSVVGLSAAGITSGLAAIGLGLGMIPGIGVAILLGSAIFIGITKILDLGGKRKKRKHQLEKERRAQMVIKNLQETINMLIDKIMDLDEKAKNAVANKEAIQKLQSILKNLRQIQNSKKREVIE